MNEVELYRKILNKWGLDAQLGMLQEECAECIVAVNKFFRNGKRELEVANLTEEMADVQNMINQLKCICPDFEKVRIEKLERVSKLLERS